MTIEQQQLKKILHYDKNSGLFTRIKTAGGSSVGDRAGFVDCHGYIRIMISGKNHKAHRLAFLYVEGYFPENFVDHKDGNRSNNTWDNLRHVTHSCNMQNRKTNRNNKSGFAGVSLDRERGKWKACARIKGKTVHLGSYDDKIEAALARITWEDNCENWHCDHLHANRKKLFVILGFPILISRRII